MAYNPNSPIPEPLINPDSFTHPDGTVLTWKGSDDGTVEYFFEGVRVVYNRGSTGGPTYARKDGNPAYIDYTHKNLKWQTTDNSGWQAVYNGKDKVLDFIDNPGNVIKTIENVILDFDLLKPAKAPKESCSNMEISNLQDLHGEYHISGKPEFFTFMVKTAAGELDFLCVRVLDIKQVCYGYMGDESKDWYVSFTRNNITLQEAISFESAQIFLMVYSGYGIKKK